MDKLVFKLAVGEAARDPNGNGTFVITEVENAVEQGVSLYRLHVTGGSLPGGNETALYGDLTVAMCEVMGMANELMRDGL